MHGIFISLIKFDVVSSQQTQNSWAETVKIPISKRCNDVRIDSAFRVQLQSRFIRHTFFQHEIWWEQIQWKCDGPSPLQAVCANTDKHIKFLVRFIWIKYNVGSKTILLI